MTSVTHVRLQRIIDEVRRPVVVNPDSLYTEIGVRSHGRGVFVKDAVPGVDLGEKLVFEIRPNELVFNIVFAWEGAVALTGPEVTGCIGSHRFPCYKVRTDVADARYLNYFFQTPYGLLLLGENSPGAAGRNRTLNRARLLKEAIPLPRLQVQRKVADDLDRIFRSLDGLREENKRLLTFALEAASSLVTRSSTPGAVKRDAANDWLPERPGHWGTMRGRHLFREVHLPPSEDDNVVTAFRDGQVTLRENRRADGFMIAVAEQGYQRVRAGDLVIHQMDGFAGAIGVAEATGKCSPEYIVLEPRLAGIENEYFAECLRVMARNRYIQVICPSVRERAPRFLYSTFKDVRLPVPPHDEQLERVQRIRCIRSAVNSLRHQQALLDEYRQAALVAAFGGQAVGPRGEAAA